LANSIPAGEETSGRRFLQWVVRHRGKHYGRGLQPVDLTGGFSHEGKRFWRPGNPFLRQDDFGPIVNFLGFAFLQAARAWYASAEGQEVYKRRAGIESTLSQGVRAFGLRRARYRGLQKTHLQQIAITAAINVERIVAWLEGRPSATTRTSRFAALAPVGILLENE